MKRKNFIIYASVVAAGLPAEYYINKYYWQQDPLISLELLSKFCSINELIEIGLEYKNLKPEECEKEKLKELILAENYNKGEVTSDKFEIIEIIKKKYTQNLYMGKQLF